VFQLDDESVVDRLVRLSELTGDALRWDESAGMRQVYAARKIEQINPLAYVSALYGRAQLLKAA
jgi:hypothetical protein